MNAMNVAVEQPGTVQFAEQSRNAASAMDVLDVVGRRIGGHLAQARHAARNRVDVVQREVDPGLVRDGENVQDRVRGAAHRHVQAHGVLKSLPGRDGARQHRIVFGLIVGAAHVHDARARLREQFLAFNLSGQGSPVARQCQTDRLIEAIHRVGSKHTGAGPAGGARVCFNGRKLGVTDRIVNGHNHRIDQVQAMLDDSVNPRPGLHWTARDKDRRDIEAHGGQQHPRRDLVTVGYAHESVGAMRIHHCLNAVGDQVAAGQGVQHPVVAHCDTVIHGDRVELFGDTARCLDGPGDQVPYVLQVNVTGNELGERISDRDDRLTEVPVPHPGRAPQGARSSHVATLGRGCRTQRATHRYTFR